jgi:hypothetical protein
LSPGSLVARATGAWATDDESVQAIESADGGFALGVLWHPEEGCESPLEAVADARIGADVARPIRGLDLAP